MNSFWETLFLGAMLIFQGVKREGLEDHVPLSKLVTFRFHVVNFPRCIMYHPEIDVGDGLLTQFCYAFGMGS